MEEKDLNKINVWLLVPIFIIMLASNSYSALADDSYIKGYAVAIIEREFHISPVSVSVKDGVVYVGAEEIAGIESGKLITALLNIKGVERVEVLPSGHAESKNVSEHRYEEQQTIKLPEKKEPLEEVFSQDEKLFDTLTADPRWPAFSGAYQYYIDDEELGRVFAASVGDIIPLYTADVPFSFGGRWQLAGQGAAFVIHDLDTSSWDQVNADYIFGVTVAYRKDSLSGIFRVFHQSSHIGDEYLLHNSVKRENYSYEAMGVLVSKDISEWIRVYGGGEYHFSRSPKELNPWVAQYGIELACPKTFFHEIFRPVAAADLKHREDNDWSGEVSLKTGLQVESEQLMNHNLRLLLGYFNGNSPNGQFYKRVDEYISLGFYYNY